MVIFVRMSRLEYQHVTDLLDEDTIARNTRISPNFALHNGACREQSNFILQKSSQIKPATSSRTTPFRLPICVSIVYSYSIILSYSHLPRTPSSRWIVLLYTRKEKINMDEERERRERRMERGWDAGRRRVRAVVNRERNETDGMRKEGSERGWQRVCRSSIGRFSPRSSIHPHSR